jgi:hypothetical protein
VNRIRTLLWAALVSAFVLTPIGARTALADDNRSERPRGFPGGAEEALGRGFEAQRHIERADSRRRHGTRDSVVARWNSIAIDASGLDHTPVAPGENRVFGEQIGPARSSRAMAIVHIAMFDAMNAIERRYRSYASALRAAPGTNRDAAIAQAARDTLVALFPSQAARFNAYLAEDMARIRNTRGRELGVALGKRTAAAILARRSADGSNHTEPRLGVDFIPSNLPGKWRQDPVSLVPSALGARWPEVRPFTMRSAAQFRLAPPPALGSAEYAAAYEEVMRLGGDGITTPTQRTPEQTFIGVFWAYDGTPSLCAPPRLYNQVAMQIAQQRRTGDVELLRLLALLNTAMADTAIAAWESKYHYQVWRPVTGIREADAGTGPTGAGDGNPATSGDEQFMPLGAPASNLAGPNFTPPFPAYPSGHAAFGGALFQTLRQFYGRDDIRFTFVSDEYNGETLDNQGNVRALHPRTFRSLSQAETENAVSRIYLGIHWAFDATEGIVQGRNVARHVFRNAFREIDD